MPGVPSHLSIPTLQAGARESSAIGRPPAAVETPPLGTGRSRIASLLARCAVVMLLSSFAGLRGQQSWLVPGDFWRAEDAIAAAAPGDRIVFAENHYEERVLLEKGLHLVGGYVSSLGIQEVPVEQTVTVVGTRMGATILVDCEGAVFLDSIETVGLDVSYCDRVHLAHSLVGGPLPCPRPLSWALLTGWTTKLYDGELSAYQTCFLGDFAQSRITGVFFPNCSVGNTGGVSVSGSTLSLDDCVAIGGNGGPTQSCVYPWSGCTYLGVLPPRPAIDNGATLIVSRSTLEAGTGGGTSPALTGLPATHREGPYLDSGRAAPGAFSQARLTTGAGDAYCLLLAPWSPNSTITPWGTLDFDLGVAEVVRQGFAGPTGIVEHDVCIPAAPEWGTVYVLQAAVFDGSEIRLSLPRYLTVADPDARPTEARGPSPLGTHSER